MKELIRFLCITRSLTDFSLPIKSTKRVKYKCIAVSNSYICIGASTGSTYIFGRDTGKLIKFISNKVNGITLLKFSNNGKILAAADSHGLVTCWEVYKSTHSFKIIREIDDFSSSIITAICWSETRLFVGDQTGRILSFSMGFSKDSLKKASVECIQKAGDPVVQMEFCTGKLIVSTKTRSILCVEEKSIFSQIGTKPRDGFYGSCFLKDSSNATPAIYSARPGSRLWEVDFDGQVLSTHQFKELLAVSPSQIINSTDLELPESNLDWSHPQAFNFPQLYPVMGRYLLTWSPGGIYLFEPRNGSVAAWNDQIKEIVGISCTGYDLYFLHMNGSVTEISLLSTKECLQSLRKKEKWEKLLQFACDHQDEIFEDVESYLAMGFHDVLTRYKEGKAEKDALITKVEDFIHKLEQCHAEVRAKVEEKLNQMWTINDAANHSDYIQNLNDTDDIKSDFSGGSGGSSSRRSLSIMSEISLNSFWQKATNIVVSKVMATSGPIKKSLQNALEEEGVYLDFGRQFAPQKISVEEKEVHSAPSSPKSARAAELRRVSSTKSLDAEDVNNEILVLSSSPSKSYSFPNLPQKDDTKAVDVKDNIPIIKLNVTKIRKKKKVKVIDIDSPGANRPPITNQFISNKKLNRDDTDYKKDIVAISSSSTSTSIQDSDARQSTANTNQVASLPLFSSHKYESESKMTSPEGLKKEKLPEKKGDNKKFESHSADTEEWYLPLPSNASSIVNKLLNTTAATRNDIRDPVVLYNSKAIHDLLQRWGNQLAKREKEFRNECFNDLPKYVQENNTSSFLSGFEYECRRLLFTQLSSAFGEISNASMLCFETNIFPKSCSTMRNNEISLLNLDTTLGEVYRNFKEEWKWLNELSDDSEQCLEVHTDECTNETNFPDSDIQNNATTEPSSNFLEVKHRKLHAVPSNESFNSSFDYCDLPAEDLTLPVEDDAVNENFSETSDQISINTALSKSDNDISDIDLIFDAVSEELYEKEFLCENFDLKDEEVCQSCVIDKCRACFVLRYFPVLNFSRMRSLLLWNGGCRWRTWLACVVHLKDIHQLSKFTTTVNTGNLSLISKEIENEDVDHFLANATGLYNVSPALVIDFVSNDKLTAYEITLLFHTGYLQTSCVESFLQYAVEQSSTSRLDTLFATNALHSALLCQPKRENIFCTCSKARPGSNTLQWRWQDLLLKLIKNIKIHYAPDLDKKMILRFSRFCANYGFWLGYIQLLSIVGDSHTLMYFVYQLKDYSLLDSLIAQGSILPSDDLWATLFNKICEDIENHDTYHTCKPIDGWSCTLRLEDLLKFAAIHSGSKFTLAMINKFRSHNVLSSEIYLSLFMAAELESKQESLVNRLIEVASGKVWSEKKNILHPQFELLKEADLTNTEAVPLLSSSFESNDYIMGESDTVWGRSINISSAECPVCTLPLCLKTMSSSTAGLIVLQCGHCFHKICLPESACLVCFHDNFTSLY